MDVHKLVQLEDGGEVAMLATLTLAWLAGTNHVTCLPYISPMPPSLHTKHSPNPTPLQDSATLFTVVRWLRQATMSMQLTMLVSLLQPPPEVFGLFDDVILMTEG